MHRFCTGTKYYFSNFVLGVFHLRNLTFNLLHDVTIVKSLPWQPLGPGVVNYTALQQLIQFKVMQRHYYYSKRSRNMLFLCVSTQFIKGVLNVCLWHICMFWVVHAIGQWMRQLCIDCALFSAVPDVYLLNWKVFTTNKILQWCHSEVSTGKKKNK